MTTIYEPDEVGVLGGTKIKVCAAIVDPAAPKLATEVNALTSHDVSLTFLQWNPTVTENTGTSPKAVGQKRQYPRPGQAQYAPIEVRYRCDPQADDDDPNNKAKAMLTEGTKQDVLVRKGPDAEDVPFAIGDRTETWRVLCGRQSVVPSGDDDFAVWVVVQMLYPIREEGHGVIVA
ncbi:hypothetical protein QWY28_17370 [Nocardioides sp. SOB77]|uniref:Uncharacterized protein n=1 Tax=Nocardioides oceani TaxID=3058369 RepID=A0ABT8FJW6_9ACTN|nr:hypothetical protein [Nocardioides oceani]MDN4174735.1 hypothetical protein [Nocardioides oceani]